MDTVILFSCIEEDQAACTENLKVDLENLLTGGQHADVELVCQGNRYIITWMLHNIFMYSDKEIPAAGKNNETPNSPLCPHPLSCHYMKFILAKLTTNFPCQYIHVYHISIVKAENWSSVTRIFCLPGTEE